jgi:hypothetical protein
MNCPYCGSNHLEESSNFNEFSCNFCKCEFRDDDGKYRIFEDGNYKKFCESVMYNLCETASPKVSNILVSVIGQLKNNGVEEIDTILEHLMLVSANVSSEMVIGLQTESDLEVVNEGIKHFTNIGNTLSKRDDLELDLHRFTRFQESNAFYEQAYPQPKTVSVDGREVVAGAVEEAQLPEAKGPMKTIGQLVSTGDFKTQFRIMSGGYGYSTYTLDPASTVGDIWLKDIATGELVNFGPQIGKKTANTRGLSEGLMDTPIEIVSPGTPDEVSGVDENAFKDQIDPNGEMPVAPEASAADLIPRAGGGVVGGVSDNLPGAMDDIGDIDDIPAQVPAQIPESTPVEPSGASGFDDSGVGPGIETPPVDVSQDDMAASFSDEELMKIAEVMAQGYQSGAISEDADFAEALMNCEAANGLCETLGTMSESDVYRVAEMTNAKLGEIAKVHNLDRSNGFEEPDLAIEPHDEIDDNSASSARIVTPDEVSVEQLQEAIEILTASVKLTNEELKDL